jgi:hypothetical protein
MAIQGRLQARGWERVSQGGATTGFARRVRGVWANYDLANPVLFGEPLVNETTLGAVRFGTTLAGVPAVVFSEVAYDLHVLGEEGRSRP